MIQRTHKKILLTLAFALIAVLASDGRSQTEAGATIDITHYKINAELLPDAHTLKAKAVVSFKALTQTQSAVLEMNGSLAISSIKAPDGQTELQFIQDRVSELNVKINLGQLYPAGSEITLTFEYSGPLATPEGGPLPDRRLAYVGPEGSYLFYAARWFPFHGYAADRATSEISLTVPSGWTVAGYSARPVIPAPAANGRLTFTFVADQPVLTGSFAAGQFITRTINSAGMQIDVFVYPGSEARVQEYGQEVAQILQVYNNRFGPYAFGGRYVIAEVDDEQHRTGATRQDLPKTMCVKA